MRTTSAWPRRLRQPAGRTHHRQHGHQPRAQRKAATTSPGDDPLCRPRERCHTDNAEFFARGPTRRLSHRGHNKGNNRPAVTEAGTAGGCSVTAIEHDSFQPAAADDDAVVCLRVQARQGWGSALEKKRKKIAALALDRKKLAAFSALGGRIPLLPIGDL